ncbi:MAG TPA: deaminase [Cyclobacteriaceae bacterium]|nr:deaminase [Cyclobacteriaceae bacterium]
MRFVLLTSVIGFALYAEITAKRSVKHTRERNKRVMLHQKRLSSLDTSFVARAMAIGQQAFEGGYRIPAGSVVVMNNEVIGEGWDRALYSGDPTAHAEIEAVRAASKYLNMLSLEGSMLYTSRRPCAMCLGVIKEVGIETIYYANSMLKPHCEVIDNARENQHYSSGARSTIEVPALIEVDLSWIKESY